MKAVLLDGHGGEEVLRVGEAPEPGLEPGAVRIGVVATAVNRADLLQRRGVYPPPPGASEILGLECAGTVLETASDVDGPEPGARVMALLAGGGYAEQAVAPAGSVMRVPDRMSLETAAAVPEVFLTAFLNLVLVGRAGAGDTVLVHGGSGGVGTAAIQLLRRIDAKVIVTAGGAERCRRCRELGADHAIDHRREALGADLDAVLGGDSLDVILDCIGAPYLAIHLERLATGGRLVLIGLMGGRTAEIDLGRVLRGRFEVVGSTLRSRPDAEKAGIVARFLERFGADVAAGAVQPVVDRTLPLERVADAHRALAAGEPFGKVVLTL